MLFRSDLRSGNDVFDMVKDLEVIFGKGDGSQPVPFFKQKTAYVIE